MHACLCFTLSQLDEVRYYAGKKSLESVTMRNRAVASPWLVDVSQPSPHSDYLDTVLSPACAKASRQGGRKTIRQQMCRLHVSPGCNG